MTSEKDAPAEMPGDEDRLSAAWLGLNPYAPETWPLGTVQRLTRIRSERGHQKFVEEVAKMTTPPRASIGSIFNACCHREECRKLEARALAAEAALAERQGWVLVPIEPTTAMVDAAGEQFDWGPPGYDDAPGGAAEPNKVYRTMIAAIRAEGSDTP